VKSTVTSRPEQFAAQFVALEAEVIAAVNACTDAQWMQPTAAEGWPVGVVAHHIAEVNGAFAGMLRTLASGETATPRVSIEEVHQANAEHAREFATVGKLETIALLREHGSVVAGLSASFSDADLDRAAGVFGGNELTVAQVIEWIVIGHAAEHMGSIRAVIGG
jgi:hypothetical protein